MTDHPIISVVVIAKNEEQKIAQCIRSIDKQNNIERKHYEVILVDDGSVDATISIAQRVCPSIKIIKNPVSSISKNRNLGWKSAQGKYVAYLDADCVASERWLANLLDEIETGDAAAVGGSNSPPENKGRFYETLNVMLNTFVGSRGSVQGMVFKQAKYVDHLPGLNIMIRKEVLEEVGGYDECFALMGEDEDFSRRISALGYKLKYIPGANVIHYQRDNYMRWAKNMFYYGRGRSWLICRHPQSFSLLFAVPVVALFLLPVYLPVIGLYSLYICLIKKCLLSFFRLWFLYIFTHMPYAIGMLSALRVKGDTEAAVERSKKPKLFLMVLKNAGNIGDAAIFSSFVSRLKSESKIFDQDNTYIMAFGPSGIDLQLLPINARNIEKVAAIAFSPSQNSRKVGHEVLGQIPRLLMLIFLKTRLVVCGGQWFHDLNRFNHFVITTVFFLVRLFNGRTGMFGAGIGPLKNRVSRFQLRLAFSSKSFLMVRDEGSYQLLRQCNLTNVHLGTDPALSLPYQYSSETRRGSIVGISPCAWTTFENIYAKNVTVIENTINNFIDLSRYLLEKGKEVIFLPSMNPEDADFSRSIIDHLQDDKNVSMVDTESLSPKEFQERIGSLECLVSMRLHPLIFATNTSIQFIALNYASKVEQYVKQFESTELLVDIKDENWSQQVVEKISKLSDYENLIVRRTEIKKQHDNLLTSFYADFDQWFAKAGH